MYSDFHHSRFAWCSKFPLLLTFSTLFPFSKEKSDFQAMTSVHLFFDPEDSSGANDLAIPVNIVGDHEISAQLVMMDSTPLVWILRILGNRIVPPPLKVFPTCLNRRDRNYVPCKNFASDPKDKYPAQQARTYAAISASATPPLVHLPEKKTLRKYSFPLFWQISCYECYLPTQLIRPNYWLLI